MSVASNALIDIFGSENVIDDVTTLTAYSRDESFTNPLRPWHIVKPRCIEEVQKLVRWANQTGTPLVPVSSGPPHFNGDTIPSAPGAVIVDLGAMSKIINIDRRNRVAQIEPGVTYGQLQPELAREGLRLTTSLLPRPNKSVVASLLEREPRLVPRFQWSALDPLRCIEVVWGDGQKLTSGNGDAVSAMAPYYPYGPAQTDFYRLLSGAQGSMGIVTWASVKCEVAPQVHKLFFVQDNKLDGLIDFTYKLLRFRFGDELLLLNCAQLAYILESEPELVKRLIGDLPPWTVMVGIAGRNHLPVERTTFLEKDISEIAQNLGLQLKNEIPGARNRKIADAVFTPSRAPEWKLEYKGGRQDIFFVSTLERAGSFVSTVQKVAEEEGYNTREIGIYIQPIQQGAACHFEFSFPYERDNKKEFSRMKALYHKTSEALFRQGAYFARPYGAWAQPTFNRDMQTAIALKKIKSIFDPNNIMNPGKLIF